MSITEVPPKLGHGLCGDSFVMAAVAALPTRGEQTCLQVLLVFPSSLLACTLPTMRLANSTHREEQRIIGTLEQGQRYNVSTQLAGHAGSRRA